MIASRHPYGSLRPRRWGSISWWYSLFLIVPLLGIIATILWNQVIAGPDVEGRVIDAYSGDGVGGAELRLGGDRTTSGNDGSFGLRSGDSATISVSRSGYESTTYDLSDDENELQIELRPNTMAGRVTHRVEEEPLAGVLIEAVLDGETVASTESGDDGSYLLEEIPEGAEIVFTYEDLAEVIEPIDERTELDVSMRPAVITGSVTNQAGEPVNGATVAIGDVWTEVDNDGSYRLEDIPESGELSFKAPGYHALSRELDDQLQQDASLEDKHIRAIYLTPGAVGDEARFQELLDLVENTELNALVIDIKDSSGFVFYDADVELAHEIDAVRPAYDVEHVLDEVKDRGIYAIARQVIFEDPILAEARNDLAIMDSEGGLWRTWNGIAWTSAYEEEVWDYNIELMMEAVELGFDEIQLDYMRFPSDGPLNRAEYNVDQHDSETRVDAITGYLAKSHEAIMPTKAYLGGDIFGMALWELGDGGIGQQLERITPHLDYIKPMIYPSHFYPGSMGFDIPNDHPYEVIYLSLQNAAERIPNDVAKLRPWLQDFSFGEGREYGPDEVREQIDAANDFGATGWMLWSAAAVYQRDALEPASD